MAIQDSINALRSKLHTLIKQYQLLQKHIKSLHNEKAALQAQLAKKQEEIELLTTKLSTYTISSVTNNAESKKELEKQINTYLKEIDKCLSMLNN